jgi:hypothetical protein
MKTRIAAIVAASAALGIAACGSDDKPAAKPALTPAAKIDPLSGRSTAVALDASFVEALGTLKLTPAPLGEGTISKDGTAILEGTTVRLKADAAELLNTTFGTDALQGGLVIGVAKITVNTA